MPSRFARFLATHPPDAALVPCSAAAIEPYRAHASETLVAFWTEVGWGSFGRGLLHIVEPASIADALSIWLPHPKPTRMPIARTAFGEIFYHRDLREEARALGLTGARPGEIEDISVIDVHFREVGVFERDVPAFFDDTLCDPLTIEKFLRRGLVDFAREVHGPLGPRECYGFVPALALGGHEDAASVRKMDMHVHWSLLRQL